MKLAFTVATLVVLAMANVLFAFASAAMESRVGDRDKNGTTGGQIRDPHSQVLHFQGVANRRSFPAERAGFSDGWSAAKSECGNFDVF